jgi:hypothetical protein
MVLLAELACAGWGSRWWARPVSAGGRMQPTCRTSSVPLTGRCLVAVHQIDDFSLPEEGELMAVEVDGTDVAVAVLDGQLHAFDDTCPHTS